MSESNFPFITVVMPVRNEELFIQDTINELLSQNYPPDRFEIIVADGESTDRTGEIVKKIAIAYPQVIFISNPSGLSSAGRNVGFKNGRGDIFIVIDGHCLIHNNRLFKDVVDCFAKSVAHCLGRPQPLDPPGISPFQKAVALARSSWMGHSGNSYIYSSFEGYVSPVSHGAIYKKEIFQKIGYVDESFDACEDVEFNYRVEKSGFKAYMSPSLAVKYFPRESVYALFQQMKRYGRGRFNFIRKHPEVFDVTTCVPPAFVICLFLYSVLLMLHSLFHFPFFSPGLIAFSVLYGLYIVLILAESTRLSIKNGVRYFFYFPPVFFSIHFGLGWGFLSSLFHSSILKLSSAARVLGTDV
ncbi:MAG: glycosyltransferase family 2 protein [bacterium]